MSGWVRGCLLLLSGGLMDPFDFILSIDWPPIYTYDSSTTTTRRHHGREWPGFGS